MTYIFTFHPLISCLPAIDYLGHRGHPVVLQTEPLTSYSQIRVSGLGDGEVAMVMMTLINQFPGIPSEFRGGQMIRLDIENGD